MNQYTGTYSPDGNKRVEHSMDGGKKWSAKAQEGGEIMPNATESLIVDVIRRNQLPVQVYDRDTRTTYQGEYSWGNMTYTEVRFMRQTEEVNMIVSYEQIRLALLNDRPFTY